jgi:5-methyltetrahydrofolate--homocysteine methyltransferase
MAIGAGMTSAIMNPLHPEEMTGIWGADVLMGTDAHCAHWIKRFREPAPEGDAGGRGRRERSGRRGGGGAGGTPEAVGA